MAAQGTQAIQEKFAHVNHDPMPMQVSALPPPRAPPGYVSKTRRSRKPSQCEVCTLLARVPYGVCGFCKKKKVYHHGRCCPENPVSPGEHPVCEVCGTAARIPYAHCLFSMVVKMYTTMADVAQRKTKTAVKTKLKSTLSLRNKAHLPHL